MSGRGAGMGRKVCSRCYLEKPFDAFTPRLDSEGPLQRWCKQCHNAYKRERRAARFISSLPEELERLQWRPCPAFPDYEVSERGELRRVGKAGSSRVGTVLYGNTTPSGYRAVGLTSSYRQSRKVLVHRLVCEAFHGPAPTYKHEVAHLDGDKLNNRAENLRWVFHRENEFHKRLHGTDNRGERHPFSKLTWEAVGQIRAECAGLRIAPVSKLASRYGVSTHCIAAVVRGATWRSGGPP